MYLLSQSFVGRYGRRAACNGQTVGQATGLAGECQHQAQGVSGGTFARLLTVFQGMRTKTNVTVGPLVL